MDALIADQVLQSRSVAKEGRACLRKEWVLVCAGDRTEQEKEEQENCVFL